MSPPIRLALIGLGKIARDQHLPAIAGEARFALVATADLGSDGIGLPHFRDIEALAASGIAIDAVVLCTPPQVRRAIAQRAIARGWHVFLEKPPGATVSEVIALRDAAAAAGVNLFAAWHSRYAAGVEPARAWLSGRIVRRATITWREDVRVWHPGQQWIWEPGGFGVFDPGINALSIATRILPRPIFVESADLDMPANRAAPIAARVAFGDAAGVPIAMDLDFREEGPQRCQITIETETGTLTLDQSGATLSIDGGTAAAVQDVLSGEYPALYGRFAEIVAAGLSDVDVAPLRLVGDIFLRARYHRADAFHD